MKKAVKILITFFFFSYKFFFLNGLLTNVIRAFVSISHPLIVLKQTRKKKKKKKTFLTQVLDLCKYTHGTYTDTHIIYIILKDHFRQ